MLCVPGRVDSVLSLVFGLTVGLAIGGAVSTEGELGFFSECPAPHILTRIQEGQNKALIRENPKGRASTCIRSSVMTGRLDRTITTWIMARALRFSDDEGDKDDKDVRSRLLR